LTGSIYGYVRVSTREQNEDRQLIALREVGVSDKNIFMGIIYHREHFEKTRVFGAHHQFQDPQAL
jgi:DNA invertase Pin-like site-specific DNA recombinase